MKRILVYGNCQAGPVGRLIERATADFEVVRAPPVHTIAPGEVDALEAAVRGADIVLAQPVDARWGRLGTAQLRAVFGRPDWIEFPSIYFDGLFPYLQFMRLADGASLIGPLVDYHDQRIVSAFLEGLPQPECVERLARADEAVCRQRFHAGLAESRRRERDLPIRVMDVVESRLGTDRVFHTFNHPANIVMWEAVTQFLRLLDVPARVDTPPVNQYLDTVVAAIPPVLADVAGVRFTDASYHQDRRPLDPVELVARYYALYAATPGFASIVEANRSAGRGDLGPAFRRLAG